MKLGRKGQSLVELALVFPLLLMLLLGIFEFGMAFNHKITLVHAAREGVRFGIIENRTDSQIRERVKTAAGNIMLTDDQITLQVFAGDKTLKVSVQKSFTVMDPVTAAIIGETIPMSASAIMSLE